MPRTNRRRSAGGGSYRRRNREIALPVVSQHQTPGQEGDRFTARIIDDDSPWVAFDLDQIRGEQPC